MRLSRFILLNTVILLLFNSCISIADKPEDTVHENTTSGSIQESGNEQQETDSSVMPVHSAAQDLPENDSEILINDYIEQDSTEPYEDEIVITGTLRETRIADAPVHTTIISSDQMQESGATNIAEALENESSIILQSSHGGTGSIMTMQGLESRYVLILVDGNPVTGRIRDELNLEELGVSNIDRIEIIKGPSSSLYGSEAVGGVINIITDSPADRFSRQDTEYDIDLSALYGNNNLTDVDVSHSLITQDFWYKVGATFHHNDPFNFAGDERIADADEQFSFGANLRAGIIPAMDWEIIIFGNYFYGDYEHNKVLKNPLTSDFQYGSRNRRALAGVKASYYSMTAGIINMKLSYNFFDHLYGQRKLDSETTSIEISTENMYSFESMWQKDLWDFNYISVLFGHSGSFLESERVSGLKDRYNGFLGLQDEMSFIDDTIVIVPGLRIDYNSAYDWAVSPKISLMYKIIEDFLTYRVSGGRAFKAPTFKDLYIDMTMPGTSTKVYGNPELMPEYSWGVNTGFDVMHNNNISFNINGFYNYIENQIAAVLLPGSDTEYQYKNYDMGYTAGLETTFGITMVPHTKIYLGYTYTYARYLDRDVNVYKDAFLVPCHKANFRIVFSTEELLDIGWLNIKASLFGEYIGKQYENGSEVEYILLDDYINLHISFDIEFFQNYSVFAGLDNILNHKVVLPYLPGIVAYAGIRARL